MLTEAHIEIVNPTGHVEDRVRIYSTGEVGVSTKQCRFRAITADRSDVESDVVITLRDNIVFLQAKAQHVLRVNGEYLQIAERLNVDRELVAFFAALDWRLRVRTIVVRAASLMSAAGAVVQSRPSQLEAWSAASATRGARKVSEHLARLRANGSIDDSGKLLVVPPTDMNPDSQSDV